LRRGDAFGGGLGIHRFALDFGRCADWLHGYHAAGTVRGCIRSVLPLHLLTDLPGDSCGEDNSSGRPESDQPALRTRLTLTANGARSFPEHDPVQAWRWLGTGELVVDVAQVAPICVQQLLEILFGIASRAHDSNLARTRARA
jgi:hypothetical protein